MKCTILICSLACATNASAQSFYVDAEIVVGGPGVGAGPPSSSFGAAAGVPGFWNVAWDNNDLPWPLRDTSGQLGQVVLNIYGHPGSGGWGFQGNTGDFARLLNDIDIPNPPTHRADYVISGLQNGFYRVWVYAVHPIGEYRPTNISVTGQANYGVQVVTGPMPGNAFQLYVTHALFDAYVNQGVLTITATDGGTFGRSAVNGFQIRLVPETPSALAIGVLLAAWVLLTRIGGEQ